jgi:cellulose biosynthesis protein BcsQ
MPTVRSSRISQDPPGLYSPLVPTVVVASYKGGAGKTALAVPIAERLAFAGLRVLLMTCDTQEDARFRLGVGRSEGAIATRHYGSGTLTVTGIRGEKVIDVLYRKGPDRMGLGSFDMAVLDTPPEVQGGSLPGVLLVATVDGADAARNIVTMLKRTPSNSDIVMVRLGREDPDDWRQNVGVMEDVLQRSLQFFPEPLLKTRRIKEAHNSGESVWTLPRTGRSTAIFLSAVETFAQMAWQRARPHHPWPAPPAASSRAPYVSGWDDDE